jgi:hypothetical protein
VKKLDLGQTISILANLGVIAGIVFLVLEIRQNNENLVAQSRYNHATEIGDLFNSFASNRELSAILVKAREGEELSPVDALQLEHVYLRIFTLWQWEIVESDLRGIPSPTERWVDRVRECPENGVITYPGMRQAWENSKGRWGDQLVSFIDGGLSVGGCN